MSYQTIRGLIIFWFSTASTRTLCLDCGLEAGREAQRCSLNWGWWGFFSAFLTPLRLWANHRSWRAFRALAEPGPDLNGERTGGPQRPSRPLWRRNLAGFYVFTAGVAAFVSWTVVAGEGRRPVPWAVGSCVDFLAFNGAKPVPCSDRHDGVIIAVVLDPRSCPSRTSDVVVQGDRTYCVAPT